MLTAQQYRERATLCRRLAERTHDPTLREQFERSAAEYDAMADEIEREAISK
jgi:hypothetical protein